MNRLQQLFGEQIEFIRLDVDNAASLPEREKYGLVARTQYALVNPQDEIIQRWFGPLNEGAMEDALQDFLDSS